MAKIFNRVKVSTATTGTGNITLGNAFVGYQTFAEGGALNGETVRYVIEDGNNWEIGEGSYSTTGPTLTRTVLESSNSDAAISLTGSARVFSAFAVEDIPTPVGDDPTFNSVTSTTSVDAATYGDGTDSVPASAVLQGTAKAWVSFTGTTTTAIEKSYNVASLTDNGTGDTAVNYTSSMSDAVYSVTAVSDLSVGSNNNVAPVNYENRSVSSSRLQTVNAAASSQDHEYISAVIHGDLA